jgi:hypothetical protein
MPDPVHVVKSERNTASNWWVNFEGWPVGSYLVMCRYYDKCEEVCPAVQSVVELIAVRNKNKFAIETAVDMISYELEEALVTEQEKAKRRAPVVITIMPYVWGYWQQNPASGIGTVGGMDFHAKSGLVFFINDLTTLRKAQVNHTPANNMLALEDPAFGKLYDLAIVGNFGFLTDLEKDCIWCVDLSPAVKPQGGKKSSDDGDDDDDGSNGDGDKASRYPTSKKQALKAIALQLREICGDEVRDIFLRRPSAITSSQTSTNDCFDLFVTSTLGDKKGVMWQLTLRAQDLKVGTFTADAVSLCDLPGAAAGVAATRDDASILCTVGRDVFEWDRTKKQGGVVFSNVGTCPRGLYLVPPGVAIGKDLERALYVLNEVDNTIQQVSQSNDGKWASVVIAGGNAERGQGREECGTAAKVNLWHPSMGCFAFKGFYFGDAESVRLLSDAYAHVRLMRHQRTLAEAFCLMNDHPETGHNGNAKTLKQSIRLLQKHVAFLASLTGAIGGWTGVSDAGQTGANGNFSRSVRAAVSLLLRGLERIQSMLQEEGAPSSVLESVVTFALNTLPVELIFGEYRMKLLGGNPTAARVQQLRANVVLERSKRTQANSLSFDYFTGAKRYGDTGYRLKKHESSVQSSQPTVFVRNKQKSAAGKDANGREVSPEEMRLLYDLARLYRPERSQKVTDTAKAKIGKQPSRSSFVPLAAPAAADTALAHSARLTDALTRRKGGRKAVKGLKGKADKIIHRQGDLVAVKAAWNEEGDMYYLCELKEHVVASYVGKKGRSFRPSKPAVRWFATNNGGGDENEEEEGDEEVYIYDYDSTVDVSAVYGLVPSFYNAVWGVSCCHGDSTLSGSSGVGSDAAGGSGGATGGSSSAGKGTTSDGARRNGGHSVHGRPRKQLVQFSITHDTHEDLQQRVNGLYQKEKEKEEIYKHLGYCESESDDDDDSGDDCDEADVDDGSFAQKVGAKAAREKAASSRGRSVLKHNYKELSSNTGQVKAIQRRKAQDKLSTCEQCGIGTEREGNKLLLCDGAGCGKEYHQLCLNPPLKVVRSGIWYCPHCGGGKQSAGTT